MMGREEVADRIREVASAAEAGRFTPPLNAALKPSTQQAKSRLVGDPGAAPPKSCFLRPSGADSSSVR